MRFTPKSKEELDRENLLPDGEYPFTVLMAADEVSKKSGKEMIKLKLNVHGPDGDYHIFDYISPEFLAYKFRHFFYSVRMGQSYESGEVEASALPDRQGYCTVSVQDAKDGYAAKNIIKDYIEPQEPAPTPQPKSKPTASTKPADNPEADDVPF